jgi:hypothetical protein
MSSDIFLDIKKYFLKVRVRGTDAGAVWPLKRGGARQKATVPAG